VLFATLAAVWTGPAWTLPIETATARMIEKNAFMVIKVSLLRARVRLSDCHRDRAANYRFKFDKRRQLFIRTHNETLSVVAVRSATKIVRPRESNTQVQPL
jgi:hypothetical protein